MRGIKRVLNDARLYLVLDHDVLPLDRLYKVLRESVQAGVPIVQLRCKSGSSRDILDFSKRAVRFLKGTVPFIVNDRADLALAAGADGVHLGQEDLPLRCARKILGRRKIIGVSCQTLADARRAEADGADYIGFGSVFKTRTKPGRQPMDLDVVARVARRIKIPVFFIGGITLRNAGEIMARGAQRIAVTRAVCLADNIGATTKEFLQFLRG